NAKQVTRLIHGKPTEVTVNYPAIDEGRTRFEENEARKLRNWVREQEELAMNGPVRPDMSMMERIAQANLRLDARYRAAVHTVALPDDEGDPITTAIRAHLAFREQANIDPRIPAQQPPTSELHPPTEWYGSGPSSPNDNDELKRRKDEFDKLK